jgi:hypothetical protein
MVVNAIKYKEPIQSIYLVVSMAMKRTIYFSKQTSHDYYTNPHKTPTKTQPSTYKMYQKYSTLTTKPNQTTMIEKQSLKLKMISFVLKFNTNFYNSNHNNPLNNSLITLKKLFLSSAELDKILLDPTQ